MNFPQSELRCSVYLGGDQHQVRSEQLVKVPVLRSEHALEHEGGEIEGEGIERVFSIWARIGRS